MDEPDDDVVRDAEDGAPGKPEEDPGDDSEEVVDGRLKHT